MKHLIEAQQVVVSRETHKLDMLKKEYAECLKTWLSAVAEKCNLKLCHLEAVARSTDHTDLCENLIKYAVIELNKRVAYRAIFYPVRLPDCTFTSKTQDPAKYWSKRKAKALVTRLEKQFYEIDGNVNVTLKNAIKELKEVYQELDNLTK